MRNAYSPGRSHRGEVPGGLFPARPVRLPKAVLCCTCCLVLLPGCGGAPAAVPSTAQEYLRVIDLEGAERTLPRKELLDPKTGEPIVQNVLAVDRQTGKEEWVPVAGLLSEPPATARYVPLTQTSPKFARKR